MDDDLLSEFIPVSIEQSQGEQFRVELFKKVSLLQEIILYMETDFEEFKGAVDNLMVEIDRLTKAMFEAFKKENEEKERNSNESSDSQQV